MKEATGELNMTVIIVIAVGILAAFFYTIIWPMIADNFNENARCADAICKCVGNCERDGMAQCYIKGKEGTKFSCPWKG